MIMTVINTNVKSLIAQDSLRANNNMLSQAMQRLSTGSKVNSAKDDAAGLAIGTRMTAQVRGLNMAIKNANDGINLAQTAEGAMEEITGMLQRMRELAVQAGNSTNTNTDRAAMNDEITQLKAEIDRVSKTTQFNSMNILDGSFNGKLQIGNNASQTMDLAIGNVSASVLGERADGPATQATRANLTVQGMSIKAADYQAKSFSVTANGVTTNINLPAVPGSSITKATIAANVDGVDKGPAASYVLGNQAYKETTVDLHADTKRVFDIRVGNSSYKAVDMTSALAGVLGISVSALNDPTGFTTSHSNAVTKDQFVTALNAALADAGVSATGSVDKYGQVKINSTNGDLVSLREGKTAAGTAGTFIASFIQAGLTDPINAINLKDPHKTGFTAAVNGGATTNIEFSDLLDDTSLVKDRSAVSKSELQNVLQKAFDRKFSGDSAIKVNIDSEGYINLKVAGGDQKVTIGEIAGTFADGVTSVGTGATTLFGAASASVDNNDTTVNIEAAGIQNVASPFQQKNLVMTVNVNGSAPVNIDMTDYLRKNVTDLGAASGEEMKNALQAAFNDHFTGNDAVTVSIGGDGKLAFAVAGGQQALDINNYTPADGTGPGNFVTNFVGAVSMNSNIQESVDYKGGALYSKQRITGQTATFVDPFSTYDAASTTNVLKPFEDANRPFTTITLNDVGTAGYVSGDSIALTATAGLTGTVSYSVTDADVADTTGKTLANNLAQAINTSSWRNDVLATAGDGKKITLTAYGSTAITGIADGGGSTAGTITAPDPTTSANAITLAGNKTLGVTVNGVAGPVVTLTNGTYSNLDDLASEINLQITKSGQYQGANAVKATVYTGYDIAHNDSVGKLNKYLVIENAAGNPLEVTGTLVTVSKVFGTEKNSEINSTRILARLGQPWNNVQTAGRVTGGVDTSGANSTIEVTIKDGSKSTKTSVTLPNQNSNRSFSDFSSDLSTAINAAFGADGYSVSSSYSDGKLSLSLDQSGDKTITLAGGAIADAFGQASVSATGSNGGDATLSSMSDVVNEINKDLSAGNSGVTASFDAASGKLKFEATSGATGTSSTLSLSGSDLAGLQFGNSLTATGSAGNATNARISDITVLSTQSATDALGSIDNAIEYVSKQRSLLGAIQNRLEHTVNNLTNIVTNTESSRSAILDADYGKETSALAKSQILTQAATAMLGASQPVTANGAVVA